MRIKNILKDNAIYIIFSIIIGIFIIKYQYNSADDIEYKTLLDNLGRLEFLKLEYFQWSGRLSAYLIGALFKYDLNIWKISNIILSFLIYVFNFSNLSFDNINFSPINIFVSIKTFLHIIILLFLIII